MSCLQSNDMLGMKKESIVRVENELDLESRRGPPDPTKFTEKEYELQGFPGLWGFFGGGWGEGGIVVLFWGCCCISFERIVT